MDQTTATNIENLHQQAITISLMGNHQKAVIVNKQIIKLEPDCLSALNRLGKCYLLLGYFHQARKYYLQALKIDPYNTIAKKNLKLLKKTALGNLKNSNNLPSHQLKCYEFLEIAGKTQTINLVKLADPQKICQLETGQPVSMVCRPRTVKIYFQNCYVGIMPDKISQRIIYLVSRGNEYTAYIKSINENRVSIFIKETKQSRKNQNIISFPPLPSNQIPYQATVSADLISQ